MSCTIPTCASASSCSSHFFLNSSAAKSDAPQSCRFTLPILRKSQCASRFRIRASSCNNVRSGPVETNLIFEKIRSFAGSTILVGVVAAMTAKLSILPARAETPAATVSEQIPVVEEQKKKNETQGESDKSSNLFEFVKPDVQDVNALQSYLKKNLESGEDQEALKILEKLVSVQPEESEWKFLMARLASEMGDNETARKVFEEILAVNPLSFEANFENALLMDRCGEGEAVVTRLEEALTIAAEESNTKEPRDVRLIMAQIQLLQKNVEGALNSYQQLSEEDPDDFRPYFCRWMIYNWLDKNTEAKEEFAKYRKLSPMKFEVDVYLGTPLSKMKLVDSGEN